MNSLPRNTFGIIDPLTKEKYPDLLVSHLELRRLAFHEWFIQKTIRESKDRQKPYILLLDHKTIKELTRKELIDVMISFQIRKDGNYAVARLFDANKIKTREEL